MTDAIARQGHSFDISTIRLVGTPTPSIVYNQFDDLGMVVGLTRFPDESAVDFKHRVLDAYVNRANSTYTGLINGVTRELGLSISSLLTVVQIDMDANFVIKFNGPYVEVWSDYPNTLEFEVERLSPDGDAFLIRDLIDYVNTHSSVCTLVSIDDSFSDNRAMTLLNQSNLKQVFSEVIPIATNFTLTYPGQKTGKILLDSMYFNEGTIFKTIVGSIGSVNNPGDYYINELTGDVVTFSNPLSGTIARYSFVEQNYVAKSSPVIIHDMQSKSFQRVMFEQILALDGTTSNGLPTPFGADLINELMSVFGLYEAE